MVNSETQYTLALSSKFFENQDTSLNQLEESLKLGIFQRCQLSLKTGNGIVMSHYNGKEKEKFFACIDLIKKYDTELVLSIACHLDRLNSNNFQLCREANFKKYQTIKDRICPNDSGNINFLCSLIQETISPLGFAEKCRIHLSYFRYENIRQCVCDKCLIEFEKLISSKEGTNFKYFNIYSLYNKNILTRWVSWRQDNISKSLKMLSDSASENVSLEIDYDYTKHFLLGPAIEEGLVFKNLCNILPELYLHIEPCKQIHKLCIGARTSPQNTYITNLKFLIGTAHKFNCALSLFFWFLNNPDQINSNLPQIFELANKLQAPGVVLFTNNPFHLANALSKAF